MSSRTREEKFHIFKQPSLKTLEENFHIYARPCIILYYSIFIILAVNGPESENSVWFSSLGRCTISATQQFLIGVKQCGEHSLGTRLSFGIECSKVRWGDWFWKKSRGLRSWIFTTILDFSVTKAKSQSDLFLFCWLCRGSYVSPRISSNGFSVSNLSWHQLVPKPVFIDSPW